MLTKDATVGAADSRLTFLEFFAGGGMARAGFAGAWRCLFANDFDAEKCAAYRANFGGDDLVEADIATLGRSDLPAMRADLAWASFPCQDLSLAGARAGLAGARSGTFHDFWRLVCDLAAAGAAPRALVIENVVGLLTSSGGKDFAAIVELLTEAGYLASALMIDARTFTPHSRPRLFIFGFAADAAPNFVTTPDREGAPGALRAAVRALPSNAADNWRWLRGPQQIHRNTELADLVDHDMAEWSADRGSNLLSKMSVRQRRAVELLSADGAVHIGAGFRRIRSENGKRIQRFEARFDGVAGCLRTPAGGSSRQFLIRIEGDDVRARLLTPREAARLMGLPEEYRLPARATTALKLLGDGVAAPVAGWISEAVLLPALRRAAYAA